MGLIGDLSGAFGAQKGYDRQKRLTRKYKKEMDRLSGELGDLSADFSQQYSTLAANFDPYDLESEFNSLYEAVIQPMEQQFTETVLPQIRQSYSGGGYGSQMFSGGRETAEAKARQTLSMNEAMLRFQGRETGIARNYQDYDRRRQDLGLQFNLEKLPIDTAFKAADAKYGAGSDLAAADAARWGAFGAVGDSAVNTIAGALAGGPAGALIGAGMSTGGMNFGGGGAPTGGAPSSTYSPEGTIIPDFFNTETASPFNF